ncbi:MAG TPA: dienelactone hydrolase family protein [Streptosporangiales bacterium]
MSGSETTAGDAVTEHAREFSVAGERVPGLVWTPARCETPLPAVLIGHGRGMDKRLGYVEAVARQLVREYGWVAVALDAPGHGERRDPGTGPGEIPPKPDPDQVRREWQACVDVLVGERVIDPGALGYWGISMGTGMGIALLADEPRIRCAALGLMHTRYYERILADAARVSCPLLFSLHWDDSRVPRNEAFDLFDAFGSADKRLHAYPGDHADFTDEEMTAYERFLAAHLTAD